MMVGGYIFLLGADENSYPDLLAMLICIIMVIIVGAGLKNSMMLNNVLNIANLIVWAGIMVGGLFEIQPTNWALSAADWNPDGKNLSAAEIKMYGDGGFLPFGWEGVMRGAATAFYAYIGFDIIATTGEECKKEWFNANILLTILYRLYRGFRYLKKLGKPAVSYSRSPISLHKYAYISGLNILTIHFLKFIQ